MEKRSVFPTNTGDRRDVYFVKEDRAYLTKHASNYHPEIVSYIQDAKPLDRLVQVLITALGAGEFWGSNSNADFFPETALKYEGPDYGYKTFESNANYFLHHNNKDPALAKGKVLKAVWNDSAKRVELVIGIDIGLDPEGAAAIDRGEALTFSMGSKVPYDICRICLNKARTRGEYCEHLRYQMNQIDPVTGQQVYAINTLPKFFDISRVLIPADKTAYMWTKIAGASNPYSVLGGAQLAALPHGKLNDVDFLMKQAELVKEARHTEQPSYKKLAGTKSASITKRVEFTTDPALTKTIDTSVPTAKSYIQSIAPSVGAEALGQFVKSGISLEKVLSSYFLLGFEPKYDELAYLVQAYQPELDDVAGYKISGLNADSGVVKALLPMIYERSFVGPVLVQRLIRAWNDLSAAEPEVKLASLHLTDVEARERAIQELIARERLLMRLGHGDQIPTSVLAQRGKPRLSPAKATGIITALVHLLRDRLPDSPVPSLEALLRLSSFWAIPGVTLSPKSVALGAAAVAGSKALGDTTPEPPAGFYSVDGYLDGLYNRAWRSRFADMQARPVAVIKTAASKTESPWLARKVFFGIPAIYAASSYQRAKQEADPNGSHGLVAKVVAKHPEVLSAGVLAEHFADGPISTRLSKLIGAGKRLKKTASLHDLEFLDTVQGPDQAWLWDLAILDTSSRIYKKLSGG